MNTPTVQKQFTIESDILYIDLRFHACANLDLDPSNAELGYRISGAEGPKTLPSSFDREDDHLKAVDRICKFSTLLFGNTRSTRVPEQKSTELK